MAKFSEKFSFKTLWRYHFFTMISLLLGIVFTVNPGIVGKACVAIGSGLVICGAITLVVYFLKAERSTHLLVTSIVLMVTGIFLGIVTTLLKVLIPIFFGMWLIITSLDNLAQSWAAKKTSEHWWIGFLMGLACCGLGIFVITQPVKALTYTIRLIGIAMIIHAALQLLSIPFERRPEEPKKDDDFIETTIVR